jgi:hypothetical protein
MELVKTWARINKSQIAQTHFYLLITLTSPSIVLQNLPPWCILQGGKNFECKNQQILERNIAIG